jgi:hypothetical protein
MPVVGMDGQKNMAQVVMGMLVESHAPFKCHVRNAEELGRFKNG